MDEDQREVVDRLCTQAGMILEDVTVEALTSVDIDDQAELKSHVDRLGEQLARAQTFVRAASSHIG
ncbi:MAG: hypothetical protein HKO08_04555 [Erythrobacter sp.]|nr:hypothetical protein [Erythrobacter sp.]